MPRHIFAPTIIYGDESLTNEATRRFSALCVNGKDQKDVMRDLFWSGLEAEEIKTGHGAIGNEDERDQGKYQTFTGPD